jgi:hypothetical protein
VAFGHAIEDFTRPLASIRSGPSRRRIARIWSGSCRERDLYQLLVEVGLPRY